MNSRGLASEVLPGAQGTRETSPAGFLPYLFGQFKGTGVWVVREGD